MFNCVHLAVERTSKMFKSKKSRIITGVIAAALVLTIGIGGTMLYLTDNDSATNTVSVGSVDVTVEEPNWDPPTDPVVPNQELAKDPQVKNEGLNDAIVFLKMTVPVENITLTADDGTKGTKAKSELFWFKQTADGASTHANNFNSNWVHLESKDAGTDLSGTTRTYVFAWHEALAPNATTDTLFDKIQVKNFIENEITAGAQKDIDIKTYAIQASEILENNADITDTLSATNLAKIYDVYVTQNPAS